VGPPRPPPGRPPDRAGSDVVKIDPNLAGVAAAFNAAGMTTAIVPKLKVGDGVAAAGVGVGAGLSALDEDDDDFGAGFDDDDGDDVFGDGFDGEDDDGDGKIDEQALWTDMSEYPDFDAGADSAQWTAAVRKREREKQNPSKAKSQQFLTKSPPNISLRSHYF